MQRYRYTVENSLKETKKKSKRETVRNAIIILRWNCYFLCGYANYLQWDTDQQTLGHVYLSSVMWPVSLSLSLWSLNMRQRTQQQKQVQFPIFIVVVVYIKLENNNLVNLSCFLKILDIILSPTSRSFFAFIVCTFNIGKALNVKKKDIQ